MRRPLQYFAGGLNINAAQQIVGRERDHAIARRQLARNLVDARRVNSAVRRLLLCHIMEAIRTIGSFLWLFGLLAFPQLLGVLLFFRLKRYQHLVAHALAFIFPLLLFVFLSWWILIYGYFRRHPGNDPEGGQLMGFLFVVVLGGALQILGSLVAQFALHAKVGTCATTR